VLLLWIILFAALGGIASAALRSHSVVPEERSARILPHFVSFATGALLGAALLGLLPEAMKGPALQSARYRPGDGGGLGVFFVIEKLVLWWHAHSQDEEGAPQPAHAITITAATGHPVSWYWW